MSHKEAKVMDEFITWCKKKYEDKNNREVKTTVEKYIFTWE